VSDSEQIDLRAAVLARLQFELAMGLESAPRVALAPRPIAAVAAPVTTVAAQPTRTAVATAQIPVTRITPIVAPTIKPVETPAAAISAADKAARWAALEARAMACQACVLAKTRLNVVFGVGNKNAEIVFVGEGPGADEDAQGEPFVGKAGQLLNKIIGAMGLKREEIYICNVVKCRPPNNRTPLPDEVGACNPYLTEQIELIAPKVIVALGSPAAKTLLNTIQGIMSLRGRWHMYKGIPVMPTYHPAFVLRQYTEEVRRAVWDDMKKVMERVKKEKSQ
jgi:uracil-DNA glycosylase